MEEEVLRYPIGRFRRPSSISPEELRTMIDTIKQLPAKLKEVLSGVPDALLDRNYRPGGWSVRQVVHHLADSHMNCLLRFKLALTEDNPTIKPYLEAEWAELSDSREMNIDVSLLILEGVHARLTHLLKGMKESDFSRTFHHPEHGRDMRLDTTLALYAWHSEHHLAHITVALHQTDSDH
ncbi:MAG: putative metal-dependent hydrolase [Flavobacteriales bacterium]|nr:putative metal-dependent hydrolase [Flavobacteriales bacterium]